MSAIRIAGKRMLKKGGREAISESLSNLQIGIAYCSQFTPLTRL